MTNILWSSNAPWTSSGYGQQTAMFAPRFRDQGHNIAFSCFYGLEGGVHDWQGMLCYPTDATRFGWLMLPQYANHHFQGDRANGIVFTLQDVWCLQQGTPGMGGLRFVCWTPIDHDPCPPKVAEFLRSVDSRVVAMSRFGQKALENEGFEDVLYAPHGVETSVFKPLDDRAEIRKSMNLPADAFIVGMVAHNSGTPARKSFATVFRAFKEFYAKHPDAILYMHSDLLGRNNGTNLIELARAVGIPDSALRASDQTLLHLNFPPHLVAQIIGSFDVLAIPSMGEGFGIPLIEAQACGVPVITTDWTAMTELCGAGWLVEGELFHDESQRSWQKLPYAGDVYDAMSEAYDKAAGLKDKAVEFASGYDADRVMGECWVPILDEVCAPREVAPLRLAA